MHTKYMQKRHRLIQNLFWGEEGADPEAIYNLCLISKTVL